MRFARHARIFRGPLDPAPVAAVLLLLMLLMLVGSLVYTPGVLVELGPGAAATATTITITSSDDVAFGGKTYKTGELGQLRTDLRSVPGNAAFTVRMEPGANPDTARQVSNLFQINLPDGKNLTGTDNATVIVAVNFRGQCFYENRPMQEAELKAALAHRLKMAERDSKKLTLILQLDKAAENQVQTRLFELAREVGIKEVLLAGRTPMFGVQP
jgi:biopolymer transport protein ExbD